MIKTFTIAGFVISVVSLLITLGIVIDEIPADSVNKLVAITIVLVAIILLVLVVQLFVEREGKKRR